MIYHAIVMYGQGNYWELFIHHFATIFSIIFCYFTNFEDYGPFILIASDLTDGLLNIGKVYRDVYGDKSRGLDYLFVVVLLSWILARNVFMLGCWYSATYKWVAFFSPVVLTDPKFDYLW
jgi:TLC domain